MSSGDTVRPEILGGHQSLESCRKCLSLGTTPHLNPDLGRGAAPYFHKPQGLQCMGRCENSL